VTESSAGPALSAAERQTAEALLTGGREQAQADLIAYAGALGSLHALSAGQPGRLAELRARYAPGATTAPRWMAAIGSGRDAFLGAAAGLGLPVAGAGDEIDELGTMLDATAPLGLVHGDACPDNVRITDGSCRSYRNTRPWPSPARRRSRYPTGGTRTCERRPVSSLTKNAPSG
jgi:hypothetical protein